MTTHQTDHLDREIEVFCKYLVGRPPDGYVIRCYRRAHEVSALHLDEVPSRFDTCVVRLAQTTPLLTRLADAFARVTSGGSLRKKLVLLLGILENSPNHQECFQSPRQHSRGLFLLTACGMIALFSANVLAGLLVLLPLRGACWLLDNLRSKAS